MVTRKSQFSPTYPQSNFKRFFCAKMLALKISYGPQDPHKAFHILSIFEPAVWWRCFGYCFGINVDFFLVFNSTPTALKGRYTLILFFLFQDHIHWR